METEQDLSQELVGEFVRAAHFSVEQVRALHQQHPALINARWEQVNETALEAASHTGRREIAEYLLASGAPLTICAAAMLGQTEAVTAFLHADPTLAQSSGAHGISLLYHAALSGKTEIADLLLAHGGGQGADAALHAATRFGHTPMVAWLLEHGATDVNILNVEQKTPLNVAVGHGYSDIADLLRRRGGLA